MGNAIRQQCCGDRDGATVKAKIDDGSRKQSVDFAAFQEAVGKKDATLLVHLLASDEPFENKQAISHPWAAKPVTVGTLAGYRIAALADNDENEPCKDKLREAGAITTLVSWTSSQRDDQRHAAVIALSLLNESNPTNCEAMVLAGAIPKLVKCLEMKPDQFKSAAASACRNIYVNSVVYRRMFVDEGGVEPLVNLLDCKDSEIQEEAVLCLDDLVMEVGQEVQMCMEAVEAAGIVAKLNALDSFEDPDTAQTVAKLKRLLAV